MGSRFELEVLKDFKYPQACMRFVFSTTNNNELIFFQRDKVIVIDTKNDDVERILYTYKEPLDDKPNFGAFNAAQDKFIVTSTGDLRFCDVKNPDGEVDLDDELEIQAIESICADEKNFYVLANKKEKKLGFYLF